MTIGKLLHHISGLDKKADFLKSIVEEHERLIEYFVHHDYNISPNHGLVGVQVIKTIEDLDNFNYFRDIHFIRWGLEQEKWDTNDPTEQFYYNELKRLVLEHYNQLS